LHFLIDSIYHDIVISLPLLLFCPNSVLFTKISGFKMTDLKQYAPVADEERRPTPLGPPNQTAETEKPFGTFDPDPSKKRLSDIDWVSPTKMVSFLLFGISMSLSHHLYYQSRAGDTVGDENEQQNKHRFVFELD
jgi:hypothetical protein